MERDTLFLQQFPEELIAPIVDHCNDLSALDADVIMFMARKAACFYHSLQSIGLVRTYGKTVVTDRILGMDKTWLKGKRVAVVDEALITGTTLWNVKRHLDLCGAISTFHVFYINKDTFNKDVIPLAPGYKELSNRDSKILSTSMVRAMSIVPRPYSVDYPLYIPASLAPWDENALYDLWGWKTNDCTTPLQMENGVFVLTIEPSPRRKRELSASLSIPDGLDHLFKIRIYGRKTKKEKLVLRVVPMAILGAMLRSSVDEIFSNLVECVRSTIDGLTAAEWFSSGKSRLRLIQYVVSHYVAEEWGREISEVLSEPLLLRDDIREMQLLFPPQVVSMVQEIIKNRQVSLFTTGPLPRVGDVAPSRPLLRGNDASIFVHGMNELFVRLYENKEKPVRDSVLDKGLHALEVGDDELDLKRLDVGFSITDLCMHAKQILSSSSDLTTLVSHYLDIAIDQGVVVPITYKKEHPGEAREQDVLSRGYRHGEEVHLCQRNIKLAKSMLSALVDGSPDRAISRIEMEKLLVLFVRFGAKAKFLEPAPIGSSSTLSVTYDKYGAVVKQGGDTFAIHGESDSFARILVASGIIEDVEIKGADPFKGYKLNNEEVGTWKGEPLSDTEGYDDADMVGYFLKRLFFDKNKKDWLLTRECHDLKNKMIAADTRKDILTLIATCDTPEHVALALSAEIRIFNSAWRHNNTPITYKTFNSKEELDSFRGENFFKTINSGQWKYRKFLESAPRRYLSDIQGCLSKINRFIWGKFVTDLRDISGPETSAKLMALVRDAGEWCLNCFALYSLWEYWAYYWNGTDMERRLISQRITNTRKLVGSAGPFPVLERMGNRGERYSESEL